MFDWAQHCPHEAHPFPVLLCVRPVARSESLPVAQTQALIRSVYAYIHDDISDREAILQRCKGVSDLVTASAPLA
jgi:hypothetical protein